MRSRAIRVSVCEGVNMSGVAYGECKANRGVWVLQRERERERQTGYVRSVALRVMRLECLGRE